MERKNLISLRLSSYKKQETVASVVGITPSYYGMIEKGVRTPSLDVAKLIAEYFGVSIESIFFTNELNN